MSQNKKVLYIGHKGHQEVIGAMGYAKENIFLVEDKLDLENYKHLENEALVVCTQTTLSVDDTRNIIDAIKLGFKQVDFPRAEDICYATQNRQDAVKELTKLCDLILIIGSNNSSNTKRLLELAKQSNIEAYLVSDPASFDFTVLGDTSSKTIGISSGASAPETLIDELIRGLLQDSSYTHSEDKESKSKWYQEGVLSSIKVVDENINFRLPVELEDQ